MKTLVDKILTAYLNFGGNRTYKEFEQFLSELLRVKYYLKHPAERDYKVIEYVQKKIIRGLEASRELMRVTVEIEDLSIEDIERKVLTSAPKKKAKAPKKKRGGDLGKIVDHGKELAESNSDKYWGREGLDLVFSPNDEHVRIGEQIPPAYKYDDMRYLESFYGLKAFEFGNWLSQQDRQNYLSGLGIALYDLHKLLHFTPKQLGIEGRLGVTFGSRGRGAALSHFDPATFSINLTRYSRPQKLEKRKLNYKRVNLILQDGGAGYYAKEYGHALDHFAGTFIEKTDSLQISGGNSTEPNPPNPEKIKYSKTSIRGLIDTLLYKIIWKSKNIQSNYYQRLTKKNGKKFDRQRNEIFARAFEIYVHYKLHKHKGKNIFLTKTKYEERLYLTLPEMQKLETDFDSLIAAIKKQL